MSTRGAPPRAEHPDPMFQRPDHCWVTLNGKMWEYAFATKKDVEPPDRWLGHITVPFCLQAPLAETKLRGSGITAPPLAPGLKKRDVLWYRRRLHRFPAAWKGDGTQRLLLHVGACDSVAQVLVNGVKFEEHRGGNSAFMHDITDALLPPRRRGGRRRSESDLDAECQEEDSTPVSDGDGDLLLLRCSDHICDVIEPRGKQLAQPYRGEGPCVATLYSNISGIWQTVWLEVVPARAHIQKVLSVPVRKVADNGDEADKWGVTLHPDIPLKISREGLEFEASIFAGHRFSQQPPLDGRQIATCRRTLAGTRRVAMHIEVPDGAARPWCPEDPHLYGIRMRLLCEGKVIDEVFSYCGLRTVTCRNETVILNGKPIFLRLVLDQGYYPDGLWTAPTDMSLRRDIALAKDMGFNGARLHQKVFEPRYFYHADRLGFLTFAEYPDWAGGKTQRWILPEDYKALIRTEWEAVVVNLHNHPSIIAWGPFNEFGPKEGWRFHRGAGGGFWSRYDPAVRSALIRSHRNFVYDVVQRTRKQDKHRRPVHDSSGWIHVDTDLWSFHTYIQDPCTLEKLLANLPPKHVRGREGQPMLVAEYAGVGWDVGGPYGRNPRRFLAGYAGRPGLPASQEEALERINKLTKCVHDSKTPFAGFCCTQLYDVEYEKNGLLRYDRRRKYSHAALRAIFDPHGAPHARPLMTAGYRRRRRKGDLAKLASEATRKLGRRLLRLTTDEKKKRRSATVERLALSQKRRRR
eukprot:TRINITY_DN20959_c0_g1_i2.p1 TRINITY_DN20959_c0_g1~~TRINITY_DN20959_c0_g1_i2.p1  ORF type:complete len:746 (+),score=94.82 TRINITY_DN20959_c0_g1_i2:82-2319(+)